MRRYNATVKNAGVKYKFCYEKNYEGEHYRASEKEAHSIFGIAVTICQLAKNRRRASGADGFGRRWKIPCT